MFSVVIPLYNKEISINKTLESVLGQTFSNFEVVLVNDGSTDGSLGVARSISDSRIRIIDQQNGGVSSARNKGIEEASYEWIVFLDADDLWKPNHLETINNMIIKFPDDDVFCTSFIRSTESLPVEQDGTISIIEDYFEEAIKYHFFWTSVTAIKKSVFSDIGVFNERLSRGEDLDLWARIGKKYRFIRSKEVTAIYVQDSDNKLSFTKTSLNKSILNNISFDGLNKSQKAYFKRLIFRKIRSCALKGDLGVLMKLILKYNVNLL
ncbi:glycosyltransferase family 2 protein [Sphingobacterium multivorum]|uniref:Glycosyltransferase family 2 protein n=1 Tax=Sphingobacterium multivorum TaxID=28454 RepID=A0ABX7CMB9_SPHMU|nr:glycosyltransferase family A protein [Sphingobacterium multivorum]QQT53189.1 glycosyltransferase family 2 protein [Sphingobacterium multivorum]